MGDRQVRETKMRLQWEAFCAAVQFLTRVPVPQRVMFGRETRGNANSASDQRYRAALARSVIYFPLVGALVTCVTAVAISLMLRFLPMELAVILALAVEAMLTGAFHEDALADTCDALGGGWTREQVLEILKDSRLGTYGTLGLGLGVACRYFSIVAIAEHEWYWTGAAILIASGTVGRWSILWLMHTVSPITDRHTQARDFGARQPGLAVFYSAMIGLPGVVPWLAIDPLGVLLSLLVASGVLLCYRWQMLRRLDGSTGDLLGCGCYLVQLTVLIVGAGRCVAGGSS